MLLAAVLVCIAQPGATEPSTKAVKANVIDLFNRAEDMQDMLSAGKISPQQIPNPHWRADSCKACHRAAPTANDVALRSKDINQLCQSCHDAISATKYIHAVGMEPSNEKRNRMPEQFRQAVKRGGGVITCISCHDLHMQCKQERFEERRENRFFFRGGPYRKRTDLCFNCHNPKNYERLNPHDQITDEGELNQVVCLVCHTVAPNRRSAKSINDVMFTIKNDLTQVCVGCHKWRPHPSQPAEVSAPGKNHLVKPSPAVLRQMKATEKAQNLILPLEPDSGRIICATCHNPHERGVQRDPRADVGADGFNRLRLQPGEIMCMSCHNL
ncbi:cytochrome c3 family protein [Noviherbaspirillum denitrificans]|nr:cytochrome c3 family protein [Noviherbaspirillum denitrificans]